MPSVSVSGKSATSSRSPKRNTGSTARSAPINPSAMAGSAASSSASTSRQESGRPKRAARVSSYSRESSSWLRVPAPVASSRVPSGTGGDDSRARRRASRASRSMASTRSWISVTR